MPQFTSLIEAQQAVQGLMDRVSEMERQMRLLSTPFEEAPIITSPYAKYATALGNVTPGTAFEDFMSVSIDVPTNALVAVWAVVDALNTDGERGDAELRHTQPGGGATSFPELTVIDTSVGVNSHMSVAGLWFPDSPAGSNTYTIRVAEAGASAGTVAFQATNSRMLVLVMPQGSVVLA